VDSLGADLVAADVVSVLREVSRLLAAGAPSAEIAAPAEASGLFAEVDVDEDEPAELVDLELADSVDVSSDELARAFGEPTELPLVHPGRARQLAYYPTPIGSAPVTVAVIASLAEDDDRVSAVTLRRDET
jgi:hypothetical protein